MSSQLGSSDANFPPPQLQTIPQTDSTLNKPETITLNKENFSSIKHDNVSSISDKLPSLRYLIGRWMHSKPYDRDSSSSNLQRLNIQLPAPLEEPSIPPEDPSSQLKGFSEPVVSYSPESLLESAIKRAAKYKVFENEKRKQKIKRYAPRIDSK